MFRGQYEAGDELQPTTKATGATRFKDPDGILPWRRRPHLFQLRGLDMLVGAYNYLDPVPKAAMKTALPLRWRGFATTTGTLITTASTHRRHTHPPKARLLVPRRGRITLERPTLLRS
jgi:hypothetical protein